LAFSLEDKTEIKSMHIKNGQIIWNNGKVALATEEMQSKMRWLF
jgi:hypothetical protein